MSDQKTMTVIVNGKQEQREIDRAEVISSSGFITCGRYVPVLHPGEEIFWDKDGAHIIDLSVFESV